MITHAELDSALSRAAFRDWQSSLIFQAKRHKNQTDEAKRAIQQATIERQRALVVAIGRGPNAVREFLCAGFEAAEAATLLDKLPSLPAPLTEAEMTQTTLQVDREISHVLDDWGITPMLAAESSFWALCHARWIGDGAFPDGVAKVFAGGDKTSSDSEALTRTFLRRACGLPVERGNTSVITDCPLSAAWWRYRIAIEVSDTLVEEGEVLTIAQAHRVLQGSVVWETFVMNLIRRLASINAPRARAAVVLSLYDHSRQNEGRSTPREIVSSCMQSVAQLGERYSFALVEWERLREAAEAGVAADMVESE